MSKNTWSENPNLATILSVGFTLVILLSGVAGVFNNWFGFDLDTFDGSKAYFQSPEEQRKSTPAQEQDFEKYANFQLLNDVADNLDNSESIATNKVAEVRDMIHCYSTTYPALQKVYNGLVTYNKKVSVWVIVIAVLWAASIWLLHALTISDKNKHIQTSKGLAKKVSNLASQVKKLRGESPEE